MFKNNGNFFLRANIQNKIFLYRWKLKPIFENLIDIPESALGLHHIYHIQPTKSKPIES